MGIIDHLVFVSPDLGAGVDYLRLLTGAEATAGGSHPGMGTHNALVGLGSSYLEIIGLDPDQPDPAGPVAFAIDRETERHLHTLAVRPGPGESLSDLADAVRATGVTVTDPVAASRSRPDGTTLEWTMAFLDGPDMAPITPFLVDWGAGSSPADELPVAGRLAQVWVQHPVPDSARRLFEALGLDLRYEVWPRPALRAEIEGTHGPVDLR